MLAGSGFESRLPVRSGWFRAARLSRNRTSASSFETYSADFTSGIALTCASAASTCGWVAVSCM